jgi:hypothetical protein
MQSSSDLEIAQLDPRSRRIERAGKLLEEIAPIRGVDGDSFQRIGDPRRRKFLGLQFAVRRSLRMTDQRLDAAEARVTAVSGLTR